MEPTLSPTEPAGETSGESAREKGLGAWSGDAAPTGFGHLLRRRRFDALELVIHATLGFAVALALVIAARQTIHVAANVNQIAQRFGSGTGVAFHAQPAVLPHASPTNVAELGSHAAAHPQLVVTNPPPVAPPGARKSALPAG